MTTGPSPEHGQRQLQLADEALNDSRYLLHGDHLRAAANRAYYCMFYAAMASLSKVSSTIPKSHRGTISLFGRHYVNTGKIDRQFAIDLRNAYNLRLRGDYGISTEVDKDQVKETIAKAAAFIAEIKRLLNED